MMMMSRNMSFSHIVVAYGVMIQLPNNPCWPVFANRLDAFIASKTLAMTNKKEPLKRLPPTVLISKDDTASMTKEDEQINEKWCFPDGPIKFEDFSSELGIKEKVDEALKVILGKDNGLTMKYICASAGYEGDQWDGPIPPIFLLASRIGLEQNRRQASADAYRLELATIHEEESEAAEKKISLVLDRLGLKTTDGSTKPGWILAASNTYEGY